MYSSRALKRKILRSVAATIGVNNSDRVCMMSRRNILTYNISKIWPCRMHIRTKHIPVWSREAKSQQANINTAFYAWATNRCNTQSCQNEESNTASSSKKTPGPVLRSFCCYCSDFVPQLCFVNRVFTQNPQVFLIISSKMAMTRWQPSDGPS